ncbi:hypothetical protein [Croceicoccus naphthovorans]|uniref:Uncharacterized protein n=1 Tax=Croceicoccus naphthovorans TaxID=1348774 RepID=A0A0G3XE09_9SPHN|nr:hypothetical protein [Croceicoccus naphthovorans]AKM09780.1 hypothetical protein AB433_06955 [Croceicoccus naphthovorans]MBB3990670.1 hypothetical protein [Croceicoccus naphthovorans]
MKLQDANDGPANLWRIAGWTLATFILLVPAVAMRFTPDVRWDAGDFVVMASMLLVVGGAIEGIVRYVPSTSVTKWGLAAAALLIFLAVWAELSVGILF